ncbi:MAG: 3-isopropylmalate dehydrogenase [Pirellulales bacterium]|nr:3-isopropylmalate dehydrogenase [Pirellulales bacterium]
MDALIVLLPGDGIGPEVTREAVRVLRAVASLFGHEFRFQEAAIGGAAVDKHGEPLPAETLETCQGADAIFLGAVGGDKWNDTPPHLRPEQGLLALRRELGLFANLRPLRAIPALHDASPLRPERLQGVDFVIVRELTGGVYFGERHEGETRATDLCKYDQHEIERIARMAGEIASGRSKRITSVDKANVLATSRLWRKTVERVMADEFPAVELRHALIDSTAMNLITHPRDFDVILTENMFGDILSDEAAGVVGSLGLLPSASCGAEKPGVFEPVHGSAPDLTGKGIANPYAAILSAALLLDQGLGLQLEAEAVRNAVDSAIGDGVLPLDIVIAEDAQAYSTTETGSTVVERITAPPASTP